MTRSYARALSLVLAAFAVTTAGASIAQASVPSQAQQSAFSGLRAEPASRVSAAVNRFADSALGRSAGVDNRHVYRIAAPTGGSWSLLPGDGKLCLVLDDREGIGTCATTAEAKAGRLSVLLVTPTPGNALGGDVTEVGVLPDDVESGRALFEGGVSKSISIRPHGVFSVTSSRPTAGLRLHRQNGTDLLVRSQTQWRSPPLKANAASTAYWTVLCQNSSEFCTISGSIWLAVHGYVEVVLKTTDGNWVCGNLVNGDGSWAGTTFCANTYAGASHPYNGTSRTGWGGPGVAGVPVFGYGRYYY